MRVDQAAEGWKTFGENDPYYGVLSDPRLKGKSLSEAQRVEFFASGTRYVEQLFSVLRDELGDLPRGTALDFGCGVGRLTQALAPHFERVLGLDVAPGMLAEAERNAGRAGLNNVEYALSTESVRLAPRSHDFVHSYIVLQHIPVSIGEPIIARLIDAVREGGIGALHMTIMPAQGAWRAGLRNFVKRNRLTRILANLALRRRWNSPAMEMNLYRCERVIEMLAASGIERFACVRVDDWGSVGLFFLFRRRPDGGSRSPWSNPVR